MIKTKIFLLIIAVTLLSGCSLLESDGSATEVIIRYQWPTIDINKYEQVVYPDVRPVTP